MNLLPLQPGDVPDTFADVDDLARDVGYRPRPRSRRASARFVDWYLEYYKDGGPATRGSSTSVECVWMGGHADPKLSALLSSRMNKRTDLPAWKALRAHAEQLAPQHLRDLFHAGGPSRFGH